MIDPMKPSALQKIKAYGVRKEGSKVIFEILDEPQGYSRKYEILYKLALKRLQSDRKVQNGLNELLETRFIEIFSTNTGDQRVRIRKIVWDRNPDVIKAEHQLIKQKMFASGRWLNPKAVIRDVRNSIYDRLKKKPSHQAVECHLNLFLSQNGHDKNDSGLVRLRKFTKPNISNDRERGQTQILFGTSAHDKTRKEEEAGRHSDEFGQENYDDSVDFSFDTDLFTTQDNEEELEFGDSDGDEIGNDGIDIGVFGSSFDGNDRNLKEKIDVNLSDIKSEDVASLDYLTNISAYLSGDDSIDIIKGFKEITVKVDNVELNVSYDPSRIELLVNFEREVNKDVAIDALRVYSRAEMLGQLSLNTLGGKELLSSRLRIPVTKFDNSEVIQMVEKMIHEAITLRKIR